MLCNIHLVFFCGLDIAPIPIHSLRPALKPCHPPLFKDRLPSADSLGQPIRPDMRKKEVNVGNSVGCKIKSRTKKAPVLPKSLFF